MNKKNLAKVLLLTGMIGAVCTGVDFKKTSDKVWSHVTINHLKTTPTDPYYTGDKTVQDTYYQEYEGNIYQNIIYDHIGDNETTWDTYQGEGITVAIIDTGLDYKADDFSESYKISNKSASFVAEYQYSYEEDPYEIPTITTTVVTENDKSAIFPDWYTEEYYGESYSYWDDHGTYGAGLIGAELDGVGTVGVAPKCTLLVCKVDFDSYSIAEAIKYAADNGADVINMSFGSYENDYYDYDTGELVGEGYEGSTEWLKNEIDYAYNKGCILVAAAGNENTQEKMYPACNDHVIGVGALDYDSHTAKASWTTFNSSKDSPDGNNNADLFAPGHVVSNAMDGTKTKAKSTFGFSEGTSFASPIVAGAAALWCEANPTLTGTDRVDAFYEAIKKTSDDMYTQGWDFKSGYGCLNVSNLVTDTQGTVSSDTSTMEDDPADPEEGGGSGYLTDEEYYGSLENPLDVTSALDTAYTETEWYGLDATEQVVYCYGEVTSVGTKTSYGYKNVVIANDVEDLTINTMNCADTINVGDTIVVCGYMKASGSSWVFCTYNSTYVECLKINGVAVGSGEGGGSGEGEGEGGDSGEGEGGDTPSTGSFTVTLSATYFESKIDGVVDIAVSISGATGTATTTWSSSNETVAKVFSTGDGTNAKIFCYAEGQSQITVKVTIGGKSVSAQAVINVTGDSHKGVDDVLSFLNCEDSVRASGIIVTLVTAIGVALLLVVDNKKKKSI